MAKKPFTRRINSFGETFLELTSARSPSFAPYAILISVLFAVHFLTNWLTILSAPLIGLIFLAFHTWGRSTIAIKHDLILVNGDALQRMSRFTMKLNQELRIEERQDKNPLLALKIGVLNEKENVTLHGLGTSRRLTPRGVLVLAELQRLGAKVTFPGFGGNVRQEESEKHDLSDRMHRVEAISAIFPAFFIFIVTLFTLAGHLPWITPAHNLLGFIPWVIYPIFFIGSSLLSKESYAESTEDGLEICLQARLKQEIPWHDIRQILITVHPEKFWFESVSVHLITHYNRTHILVNRELTLVRGALDIIDLARSKGIGVKVVYQDTVEKEDVFLDIKPQEKPLPKEQITPAAEFNQDVVERA